MPSLPSHLIQRGLADRKVLDMQFGFVGLQLVKDVRNTTRCYGNVVLHHVGVLVLWLADRKGHSYTPSWKIP